MFERGNFLSLICEHIALHNKISSPHKFKLMCVGTKKLPPMWKSLTSGYWSWCNYSWLWCHCGDTWLWSWCGDSRLWLWGWSGCLGNTTSSDVTSGDSWEGVGRVLQWSAGRYLTTQWICRVSYQGATSWQAWVVSTSEKFKT